MRLNVSAGWAYPVDVPATSVTIDDDGAVTWKDQRIGFVWKGSRTYSPPIHKGSRIVRYHKQVPEWHAHPTRRFDPLHRKDTRQEAVRHLIADAMRGGSS